MDAHNRGTLEGDARDVDFDLARFVRHSCASNWRVRRRGKSFQERAAGPQCDQPATFQADVVPVLAKYCTGCHGAEKAKGGLNLAAFTEEGAARAQRKLWDAS